MHAWSEDNRILAKLNLQQRPSARMSQRGTSCQLKMLLASVLVELASHPHSNSSGDESGLWICHRLYHAHGLHNLKHEQMSTSNASLCKASAQLWRNCVDPCAFYDLQHTCAPTDLEFVHQFVRTSTNLPAQRRP
jgi:hypothetical protein